MNTATTPNTTHAITSTHVPTHVPTTHAQVTPEQASWLKDVDKDVRRREGQARQVKEQVETERRTQEALLRDLRLQQQAVQQDLAKVPSHSELPRRQSKARR